MPSAGRAAFDSALDWRAMSLVICCSRTSSAPMIAFTSSSCCFASTWTAPPSATLISREFAELTEEAYAAVLSNRKASPFEATLASPPLSTWARRPRASASNRFIFLRVS